MLKIWRAGKTLKKWSYWLGSPLYSGTLCCFAHLRYVNRGVLRAPILRVSAETWVKLLLLRCSNVIFKLNNIFIYLLLNDRDSLTYILNQLSSHQVMATIFLWVYHYDGPSWPHSPSITVVLVWLSWLGEAENL